MSDIEKTVGNGEMGPLGDRDAYDPAMALSHPPFLAYAVMPLVNAPARAR